MCRLIWLKTDKLATINVTVLKKIISYIATNWSLDNLYVFITDLLTGSEPMDPRGDIGVDPTSLPRPTAGSIEKQNSYKSHIDSASSSLTTYKTSCISSNDSNA